MTDEDNLMDGSLQPLTDGLQATLDVTAQLLAEAEEAERKARDGGAGVDDIIADLEKSWAALPVIEFKGDENDISNTRLVTGDVSYIDDWDETQVPVVKQMVAMCRAVVAVSTSPPRRSRLIVWAFGHDPKAERRDAEAGRDTFAACCHQLNVRPYVIRAMLQHQWYRHAITFAQPLPDSIDPLPEGLLGEGYLRDFSCGGDALEVAWKFPSLDLPSFLGRVVSQARVTHAQADAAFTELVNAGLLGMREGRVWFTGRSPEYLARRRTSFARSFIEPEVSREEGDSLQDLMGSTL